MAQQVVVIGAGITGLTAAYRAARAGKKVLLISQQEPGGAISSSQIDGFTIERGAAIMVELPELAALIDELGLRPQVVYPSTRKFAQGIWLDGSPRYLPRSLLALIKSPLISPWRRFTLPLKVFLGSLRLAAERDVSIAEVAKSFLGERGVKYMLTPALRAAYGQDASQISARVLLRSALAGSESVKCRSLLRSRRRRRGFMLRGGNQSLTAALAQRFQSLGGELRVGRICEIKRNQSSFILLAESGETFESDQVVLSAGADLLLNFAPHLQLEIPPAIPLAIVHFALDDAVFRKRRSANAVPLLGVLFPEGEVFGAMFPSQLFSHLAPSGKQLAAVYLGGAAWCKKGVPDQDKLIEMAARGLATILPDSAPRFLSTSVWTPAIPSYPVGSDQFDHKVKQLELSTAGFFAPLRERGGPGVGDRVAVASKIGV